MRILARRLKGGAARADNIRSMKGSNRASGGRLSPASLLAVLALAAAASSAYAVQAAPAPPPLPGDLPIELFPDSADIRAKYWNGFFAAPLRALASRSPAVVENEHGSFRLSYERDGGYHYAVVSAVARGLPSGQKSPLYSQGTWILKRSPTDGSPLQAKVFLRGDPGTFLRIYPDGDRSRMDVVAYGGVLNEKVPLPAPFERVFASPLSDIVSWSRDVVDWDLFSPKPGLYREVRSLVEATRSRLGGLRYADDGALDSSGRPVLIATGERQAGETGLNCSGFAKWVVDGLYEPLTGRMLDPRAMASKRIDERVTDAAGPYEADLDPFFGLDWTRNLALAALDARYASRRHEAWEADVRISPFALIAGKGGLSDPDAINGASAYAPYAAYQADLGYQADGLKALLYVLALREPGNIYLASVSRKSGGAIPGLSRHYHVAVLAPYFEDSGEFKVAAFESDVETSVEAIMARLPKDFVHLVRVKAGRDYDPAPLPD
jgi:hypothetical protein